jgi:predicted phage-related endonuclease
MSDFSATTRNSAIWSGDSRKVANGKANEVILTKQGKLEIPDLSNIEAVQMGHVMEPVIGRLAQAQLGTELVKIEESLTHAKHPWFKSHFDFAGKQGGKSFLVEAKNYNASVRGKFDVAGICPPADMAQLVHEAAVYGVDLVYLAILFGGQEFLLIPFTITDEQKEDLVKQMAVVWGHAQAGTTLPPEDLDQVRLLYPQEVTGTLKTASASVEQACLALAQIKANIKALEAQEEQYQTLVSGYMGDASVLSNIEGQVLATWKNAKASPKFDSKLFQSSMPDIYQQFVRDIPGSRRFLLK